MPLHPCRNPSIRMKRSKFARSAEVGVEESAASHGVPVEDRWVAGSEEVPEVLMEGVVLLPRPMRGQRWVDLPPSPRC